MRSRAVAAAILIAAGCATAPARATPAPAVEVTLDVFEGPLAMYGEWIMVGRYGRVWRPLHVGAGWQPYLHGEWVWTAEGWFWLTDEPWGWATYHYGRWAYEPGLGWVWIPDVVWAPAWVVWRVGDGVVGWAPLYPGFAVWWVEAYPLEPAHWVFVPTSRFVGVRVETILLPRARVPALVRSSRPAPPPPSAARRSTAPPLGGPPPRLVERHVGRPVKPARIVAVPAPADAGRPVERGAVPVYRPAPRAAGGAAKAAPASPTQAPAVAAPRPAAPAPERPAATPERRPAPATKPAPARPAPARSAEEKERERRPEARP